MNNRILLLLSISLMVLSIVLRLAIIGNTESASNEVESTEPVSEPVSEAPVEPVSEPIPRIETEVVPEVTTEYTFYDVPLDLDTQKAIADICSEYGIEYELILGIISVESRFRPDAIGDGGASFGLMQIQPKWWRALMEREGVTDLTDPLQNVRCGCAILTDLKNRYGSEYRALQAYNTGNPNSNNGYADKVYRAISNFMEVEL